MRTFTTLLSAAVFSVATAAGAAEYKWDMANEYPAGSIQGKADKHFARLLEEKSGGRVEITHHFGGALGFKSADQLDAVGDGIVTMANTFIAQLSGINELFLLPSLPLLTDGADDARALYEISRPHYDAVFEKYNQKLLYASPWPPSGLWGTKALNSMEALQNFKFRTYDKNGTRVFQSVGAAPVQLSWADVVPQLSTGAVNGVLTSAEAGLSAQFPEYLNYFTEINYSTPINVATINLDTWNSLPADIRTAMEEAAAETEVYLWTELTDIVARNYERAEELGVTVVTEHSDGYRQKLAEAAAPIIEQWQQDMGKAGDEILTEYRAR